MRPLKNLVHGPHEHTEMQANSPILVLDREVSHQELRERFHCVISLPSGAKVRQPTMAGQMVRNVVMTKWPASWARKPFECRRAARSPAQPNSQDRSQPLPRTDSSVGPLLLCDELEQR